MARNNKVAFVTGAGGQDGSYLCEELLARGYEVHGMVRRTSVVNNYRLEHISEGDRFRLHYGDLLDQGAMGRLFAEVKPDVFFNLAAQSHVQVSFELPNYTASVNAVGVASCLDLIKSYPACRFYQASTSELFGGKAHHRLDEDSIMQPQSPYAMAKYFAYDMVKLYRQAHNLFCVNGILFNHESPRRSKNFVTRKITYGLGKIHRGGRDIIELGNINAVRDWGYAPEYCAAMIDMLEADSPQDICIGTGRAETVKNFASLASSYFGYDLMWESSYGSSIGFDRASGRELFRTSDRYLRPSEVDFLLCNPARAKQALGFEAKVQLEDLVNIMCEHDSKERIF